MILILLLGVFGKHERAMFRGFLYFYIFVFLYYGKLELDMGLFFIKGD